MKRLILITNIIALVLIPKLLLASSLEFVDYPTVVYPDEKINVTVKWDGIPDNTGLMLRVQFENWATEEPFCFYKDVLNFTPNGSTTLTLEIPKDIKMAAGCRYVAAFISKEKTWEETYLMVPTRNEVSLGAFLEITSYPKKVMRGEVAQVGLKWTKIPLSKDYKLILQLENWDVSPSILVTMEIPDIKEDGTATGLISVPLELASADKCRFVAAFISRKKGWEDTYCVFKTPKDVTIN